METTVMIGEKPKVASRLANALGNYSIKENRGVKNYEIETDDRKIIIAPAVGHIFNLDQIEDGWDYPVFDVEWKPIFETSDSSDYVKKYYNNLKDQIEKADSYINACDFDLEGCLHPDEKVVVEHGDEILTKKVGDLIDKFIEKQKAGEVDGFEYAEPELKILGMEDWKNEFHNIEKVMRRPADETYLEITLFNGRKVKVSKNHPMLVATEKGLEHREAEELKEGDNVLSTKKIPSSEDKKEIDLIELFEDIYIHNFKQKMEIMPAEMREHVDKTRKQCLNYRYNDRMPKDIFLELESRLGVSRENLTISSYKGSTRLPAKLKLDYKLGRFIGLYLAEGCIDSGGFIGLYFGPKEDELVQEVQDFLRETIKTDGKVRKREIEGSYGDSECFEVGTKSKILRRLLKEFEIGEESGDKKLPQWILSAPEEFKEGLVSGYWDGDGSLFIDQNDRRAIASAGSKSRELLDDLFYLLQSIGVNPSFQQWNYSEREMTNLTIGRNEEVSRLAANYLEINEEFRNTLESTDSSSRTNLIDSLPKCLAQRQGNIQIKKNVLKNQSTVPTKDVSGWEPEMKTYVDGDITFLEVKKIEEKETEADYFYDFQTETRNYQHGNGIVSHNSVIGYSILKNIADAPEDRIERMKFSTLTPDDLQEAFDNLEEFDKGMTEAGVTRHILDYYYGINVSRALMKAVRDNDRYKTLSTGRVQGPTLKILADREREIQAFEPDPYWELYLIHSEFEAQWEDDEDRIWDEEAADNVFNDVYGETEAEVTNIKVNNYSHNPPIPFNLTGLQSEASSQFNISPKQTQSIAQTLYENGLISYPRTESQKLPPKLGYKTLLKKLKGQEKYTEKAKKVLKKDKNDNLYTTQGKKEDDAHPAIYPTGEPPSGLSKQEGRIYDLIVKRFFAVFGKAAKRQSLTFTLDVNDHEFKAKSKITKERNWYDLYDPYVRVDEAELPEMEEGQILDVEDFRKDEKETQPPNRYSQSGIVNQLEKQDLGTKCLTGDQEVIVRDSGSINTKSVSELFKGKKVHNNGNVQIMDTEENLEVIGYDNNFSISEFSGISRRKLETNENVVEIKLSDNSTITLTSNHPVLISDQGELKYVEAGELESNSKVIRSHRGGIGSSEKIKFDKFVKKIDQNSSLYGDCDLKKFRGELGLSQRELADRLDTSRSTLSKVENRKHGLLRYWKNANISEPEYISSENFDLKIKNPFPIETNPAFMRIVAMLQGDGSFDSQGKKKENKLDFRYHNTEKELIDQFCRDIEKIFGYSPKKNSQSPSTGTKTRYYVQLPAVIGRIISIITNHLSRTWITKQENLDHYIGALVADEGHVSPSEPKIFISNTDDDILKNCQDGLKELNIDSKINRNQKKLYIRGRRNLENFLEKIPLFSTRKHQALINLLERHYRKKEQEKGSIWKEKEILKIIQSGSRELKQIAQETGLKPPVVKYHLKSLREKEYAEKIVKGISERPRKKIYYKSKKDISNTFYSEIGENAIGEAHTSTVDSVNQIEYDGYVYDILNTENQNFALGNRIIVHNSTRAKTVDRLYDRNYIEDKPIKVTDLGLAIIDTLEDYCSNVISEELTREFEDKMDEIQEGDNTREEVLGEARKELGDILEKFKDNQKQIGAELVNTIDAERERRRQLGECQECEDGILRMIKSKGSKFVGCSNYPDCENTYPLPNNGNIEPVGETCEECGTPKIKVTRKKGKNYSMCIDPDCPTKDDW